MRQRLAYHLACDNVRVQTRNVRDELNVLPSRLEGTSYSSLDAFDATRRRATRRGPRLSADSSALTMRTKLEI